MQAGLIEAMIRGDGLAWATVAGLWLLAATLAFTQRGPRGGHGSIFAILALAAATAFVGLSASKAMAIPRIRWKVAFEPSLMAAQGDTWRKLRGPAVQLTVGGVPELAVPTIDGDDRWVLFGLITGEPLPGLPPAAAGLPDAGAPRLCGGEGDRCRAWPAAWPAPTSTTVVNDFFWAKDTTGGALAYDVESGLYLRDAAGLRERGYAMDLVGRVTGPSREGLAPLFVARRIANGRLDAARVVPTGAAGFRLERASVSLTGGPDAYSFVGGPLLLACVLALPFAVLAYLLAPVWLRHMLAGRAAVTRRLAQPLVAVPLLEGPRSLGLATVSDDVDVGGAWLSRGSLIAIGPAAQGGQAVTSVSWFELPLPAGDEAPPSRDGGEVPRDGGDVSRDEDAAPRSSRRVGMLVPGDAGPFERTARAWILPFSHGVAMVALGVSLAAPAIVAIASLVL